MSHWVILSNELHSREDKVEIVWFSGLVLEGRSTTFTQNLSAAVPSSRKKAMFCLAAQGQYEMEQLSSQIHKFKNDINA